MPKIVIQGIKEETVLEQSIKLIDRLQSIIGCPRDYFSMELPQSTFIMDGKKVEPPTYINMYWFDIGQTVQDQVAKSITEIFNNESECIEVVFHKLHESQYYENGEHF